APRFPQRVEPLIAHREIVRAPVRRVRRREPFERRRDRGRIVAHRFVAADEIRVRIDQDDVVAVETAGAEEIEKDRAAPEERFDVAVERLRIEPAELRQQLSLATDPLQERFHVVASRSAHHQMPSAVARIAIAATYRGSDGATRCRKVTRPLPNRSTASVLTAVRPVRWNNIQIPPPTARTIR